MSESRLQSLHEAAVFDGLNAYAVNREFTLQHVSRSILTFTLH